MTPVRIDPSLAADLAIVCRWWGLSLNDHRELFRAAVVADREAVARAFRVLAQAIAENPAHGLTERIRQRIALEKEKA